MITRELLDEALAPTPWDLGNKVLYDLCTSHPRHDDEQAIIAKIWLIGRSYAAAIERRRTSSIAASPGDLFYEVDVVRAIRGSAIDDWLDSISESDLRNGSRSLAIHKKVTDLFQRISGLDKRSLASKYLHFHKPGHFFIFDARAKDSVSAILKGYRSRRSNKTDDSDSTYQNFWQRCDELHSRISSSLGVSLTPRQLDKLLLLWSRKYTGRKKIPPPNLPLERTAAF